MYSPPSAEMLVHTHATSTQLEHLMLHQMVWQQLLAVSMQVAGAGHSSGPQLMAVSLHVAGRSTVEPSAVRMVTNIAP